MTELPFAEDVPYWKTGTGSPDKWIDKAMTEIDRAGGSVEQCAWGSEPTRGRAAYLLAFRVNGDLFRIIWPVLPSKRDETGAARRQAATMVYHEVKSRCVAARVLGHRTAFFAYLSLPDGRRASDLATPELLEHVPELIPARITDERDP